MEIDYTTYNPQTDSKIYMNYSAEDFRKKKSVNKERLQEELGLAVDKKKYMVGLISRLTDQKGLDLINAIMDRLVDEYTQFVVIGTGEPQHIHVTAEAFQIDPTITASVMGIILLIMLLIRVLIRTRKKGQEGKHLKCNQVFLHLKRGDLIGNNKKTK